MAGAREIIASAATLVLALLLGSCLVWGTLAQKCGGLVLVGFWGVAEWRNHVHLERQVKEMECQWKEKRAAHGMCVSEMAWPCLPYLAIEVVNW